MIKRIFSALRAGLLLRCLADLALIAVLMMLTRAVFFCENAPLFTHSPRAYWLMFIGGLKYDVAAIMYGNALWLLMVLFPLRLKERRGWWKAQRVVFTLCNSLLLLANLCDTVFFAYRQSRTTASIFREFGGESNLAGIIGTEIVSHWYLVLLFVAMTYCLWRFYIPPVTAGSRRLAASARRYYATGLLELGIVVFCFISGVRGSFPSRFQRPMSVNFAQRYAVAPADAAVVLNTPFTIIRTLGHYAPIMPPFYSSDEELLAVYSPLHPAADAPGPLAGKNVVVILLESFSREFSGLLNPQIDGGEYKGYTPCLDSIIARSFRFESTFSNAGFSIDAMPAVFASTPRMDGSFVVSLYGQNKIEGLPAILGEKGYETAFFHGADNESLGLQGFARHCGFQRYYGLTEYCADPATGGMNDFDGSWGIWDEEFLQYFCRTLSTFSQPFLAGVFTLSSHHPFVVPERYKDRFQKEPGLEVYPTIRYADMALGHFFDEAAKQPWFRNTLFVLSADHAFLHPTEHAEYNTPVGQARIPVILYDPSGEIVPPGVKPGMMSQIDVMPTLLALMGHDKPFFAFGRNAFDSEAEPWAIRWTNVPELMMDNHVIQLDTDSWKTRALFDYSSDPLLQTNLLDSGNPRQAQMDSLLRAIIQTYQTLEGQNRVSASTYNTSTTPQNPSH